MRASDVITPRPTPYPNPTCDVASNMPASWTNHYTPTPPIRPKRKTLSSVGIMETILLVDWSFCSHLSCEVILLACTALNLFSWLNAAWLNVSVVRRSPFCQLITGKKCRYIIGYWAVWDGLILWLSSFFFGWWLLGYVPGGAPLSQLNSGVEDAMAISTKWWVTSSKHCTKTCTKATKVQQNHPQHPVSRSVLAQVDKKRALVKSQRKAPTPEWEDASDTLSKAEGFGEIPKESTYARADFFFGLMLRSSSR